MPPLGEDFLMRSAQKRKVATRCWNRAIMSAATGAQVSTSTRLSSLIQLIILIVLIGPRELAAETMRRRGERKWGVCRRR